METLEAFQSLKRAGKIRQYGVSNFDLNEVEDAIALAVTKSLPIRCCTA